jgi:hypothetical protein
MPIEKGTTARSLRFIAKFPMKSERQKRATKDLMARSVIAVVNALRILTAMHLEKHVRNGGK